MKDKPQRSSAERRRFRLKMTSGFLDVIVWPPNERGDRRISFETSLPQPLQTEALTAERCRIIADSLSQDGTVPSGHRKWLAQLLSGIHLNLAFTSSPEWDLRAALALEKKRGRPSTASARDFYLALYFKLGRKGKISREELLTRLEREFRIGQSSLELALKRWSNEARQIVEELLQADSEQGLDTKRAVEDYVDGLRQALTRCIVMAGYMPGVEMA